MRTTTDIEHQANPLKRRPELVLLAFLWAVSLLILATPFADTLLVKAIFLSVPALLSVLVTVTQPQLGFAVWGFGVALLTTQTGFQLDVGGIRTSALEVVAVFLLLAILFIQRRRSWLPAFNMPGRRLYTLFAAYACALLLISLVQGVPPDLAFFQFKGFLLYPLIALILLAGIPSPRALRWLVTVVVLWYLFWGAQGVTQFVRETVRTGSVFQTSGNYAAINIYGVTLATVSLFLVGFAEHAERRWLRILGHLLAFALFVAATASLSRTTWITFSAGIIFLFLFGRTGKRNLLLWFFLIVVVTLSLIPQEVLWQRVLQLSDSSTQNRTVLLASGLQAWKARWLTGWGWGRAFLLSNPPVFETLSLTALLTLDSEAFLSPTNSLPWYHNDYLNLAVQTGVIGLGLYLAFWQRVVAAARRWLAANGSQEMAGYVAGSAAALVGILASGLFEHTLWRPDSAGMVGLFLGILLVAMHFGQAGDHRQVS